MQMVDIVLKTKTNKKLLKYQREIDHRFFLFNMINWSVLFFIQGRKKFTYSTFPNRNFVTTVLLALKILTLVVVCFW